MFGLDSAIQQLLITFGYIAIFGIVFAESGLFFGFFLPGDSLLFTAGILAGQGYFDPVILIVGISFFAIAGDQVGYWTGKKFGRKIFNNPKSVFFTPSHVTKAEEFYKKHGNKTIILARFVPVIRTFAPIVAGIAHMDYRTFVANNILGGILWTNIFVLAGFFLGKFIPADSITLIILGIIVLSVIPVIFHLLKRKN